MVGVGKKCPQGRRELTSVRTPSSKQSNYLSSKAELIFLVFVLKHTHTVDHGIFFLGRTYPHVFVYKSLS